MAGKLRQVYTSLACGYGSLVMGALNVWPSYTTQIYSSNTTTPLSAPMTQGEESLLGSLPSLGAMLGATIAGAIINRLGRKNGGVVLSLPYVVAWSIILVSSNMNIILAARFLSGVGGGAYMILAPVFISEISEASIRGALSTSLLFLYSLGCILSYLLGWFFSYRTVIWINMALSIVATFLAILVVESPVYLLRQRRDEEARQCLAKYRGLPANAIAVVDEFSRLKQQIMPSVELTNLKDKDTNAEQSEKEKLNAENVESLKTQTMSPIKMLFVSPVSRKALLIVLVVISNQVMMGIVPVQVFAKSVFMRADASRADLYTVLFALCLFFGSLVTTFISDLAGRRVLLITSSILVCACMTTLSFLINGGNPFVTVFVILAYCFCFMAGAGSVPYVLLAEVFVSEVHSVASTLIIDWVWFLNFVIIGVFPYMVSTIGMNGAFLYFAAMALYNAVIGYFIVPETKGLTSDQIQELLTTKRK